MLPRLWLLVGSDRPTDRRCQLLSCPGQLKRFLMQQDFWDLFGHEQTPVNLRNAYPKIAYCRQFWGRHFWVNPSSEMPTPVILYIFTFLFIFLWPFGVNILESVCLLLSNLVLYFWDELNISKKVTEIQSTLIHYDNYNIYIYCPSRGLLGYPQPWRCHQLPPWPGAVFCYEFFTKIISFSFRALPATSTNLSKKK